MSDDDTDRAPFEVDAELLHQLRKACDGKNNHTVNKAEFHLRYSAKRGYRAQYDWLQQRTRAALASGNWGLLRDLMISLW